MTLTDSEKSRFMLAEQLDDDKKWFEIGMDYFEKDWQIATECFSRALAIKPFDSEYYFNRGRKRLSQDRFSEALADFIMATKLDTETGMKWHYAGDVR